MTGDPALTGQHVRWDDVPAQVPAPGIERRIVTGRQLMACRLRFDAHVVTAVHRHPHEQMTLVLAGRVRFTIEGTERIVKAGDVVHFPPNVEHGATMLDEEVVLIDVFTPVREDLLFTAPRALDT
jgi:quercetin dioxygenase-like cupin family protein